MKTRIRKTEGRHMRSEGELEAETVLQAASFLVRTWSGKPTLHTVLTTASTETKGDVVKINLPSQYPSTEMVSAYRLWRASLWHEAMHHLYGTFKDLPQYASFTMRRIHNIIEDYRIEHEGLKKYSRMKRELALRKAVYYHLTKEPVNEIQAFAQLLLLEAVRVNVIPKPIIEAVKYTKQAVNSGARSSDVTERAAEILGITSPYPWCTIRNQVGYMLASSEKIKDKDLPKIVEIWIEEREKAERQVGLGEQGSEERQTRDAEWTYRGEEVVEVLRPLEEVKQELEEVRRINRQIKRKIHSLLSE